MKNAWYFVAVVLVTSMSAVLGQSAISFLDLGAGWRGLTKQSDPFDKRKTDLIQITRGNFTFRCGEVNMSVSSGGFNGFSFDAEIKYIIDEQDAADKKGKFSTYLSGSNLIGKSRYYSAKLSEKEVETLKNGRILKVAGRFSKDSGWTTNELSLDGFTSAYDEMCKQLDQVS